MGPRIWKASVAAIAVSLTIMAAAPVAAQSTRATTHAGGAGIGFGPTTVVEDQREGAEPDVKVCGPDATWSYNNCGLDNPYVSWPFGFSTTSSFISRSEDQGKTFKLVPNNLGTGKPTACPGGGDTDLGVSPGATQAQDRLSFIDLQGLTNFSSGTSPDGGTTFTGNCVTSLAAPVDRQWFGFYKNQATASTPGGLGTGPAAYLDYDVVAGATTAASCVNNVGGNVFVVQKSTDAGLTYGAPVVADCNDGIAGNMQVNQTNGHVFAIHSAYKNAANPGATDVVTVNKSTDGGATWTKTVAFTPTVPSCSPDCTVGQDFAVLAIDKVGGLYAVWSQATVNMTSTITGPSHIYYAYSSNEGATWTAEQQVDAAATNAETGQPTDVDIFPWIAAGDPGKIDVVWYGTTRANNATPYDSGSQTTDWFPYLTQSSNANGSSATFSTPVPIAQHPNHNGGICTMGIGCTTGGDRSLADFFQVDVNKAGGADVIFADTSNNSNTSASGNQSALVDEARQISGPTLFSTTLSGTTTTCAAVTATPCQTDQTGDARYEANGIVNGNVPKLDITGSSLNISPTDPLSLDVRMNIADLSALPGVVDSAINGNNQYVDYLTSWNYHVPGHGQADYDSTGNIYYAYLEVNRATGAVTAYDGATCGVLAGTRDKFLVYPGQNAITYSVNKGTPGTIDLYVPRADVGNPAAGASLYSVTAHAVGQTAPAGPNNCNTATNRTVSMGNNPDATGQLFDVYDKSPAYTALLTAPSGTGGPPTATPEPGSGALYGGGLVALLAGMALWRRRRHATKGKRDDVA